MNKLKNWFYNFMSGRYGTDSLSTFLLNLSLVLIVLNIFCHSFLLNWLTLIVIFFNFYRMFSKNFKQRSQENAYFLNMLNPIKKRLNLIKLSING